MKLYVAVLGLLTFVASPEKPGPVEVLFLDAAAGGGEMPAHQMRLRYYVRGADGGPQLVEVHSAEPLELAAGPGGGEAVALRRWDEFVHLGEVLGLGRAPAVRSACTGPGALSDCEAEGGKLLAARLVLSGGTLEPAEVLHGGGEVQLAAGWGEPEKEWGFGLPGAELEVERRWHTFNGGLFTLDLPAGEAEVRVGGSRLVLEPLEMEICAELSGWTGSAPCVFVVIDNSRRRPDTGVASGSPGGPAAAGDREDEEFALVYALLEEPPPAERRLIPILPKDENPPESRCIPPVVAPAGGGGS